MHAEYLHGAVGQVSAAWMHGSKGLLREAASKAAAGTRIHIAAAHRQVADLHTNTNIELHSQQRCAPSWRCT